ncbi:MAG: LacI family DNA-binding transcriptional regulator, partial [Victivallaceae bacterium]|nr:LacI family DNA-binding transcriptional regulator [Victivallaceae bacterium]
ATGSRVLSGGGNVRQEVCRKVLETARDLGYRNTSQRVLLICETLVPSVYYATMIDELAKLLRFSGYMVELIDRHSLSLVEERCVAGAISIAALDGLEHYWGKQHTLPLVCINTEPNHFSGVYSVLNDDFQGTSQMTGHLIELGHRKIGLYGWGLLPRPDNLCNQRRVCAFQETVRAHNLRDDLIASRCRQEDDLIAMIEGLLQQGATAIIGTGEETTLELIHVLQRLKCKIPEDVSVIGWLAPYFCTLSIPVLTGVMQNFRMIAERSVRLLLDQIEGKTAFGDQIIPGLWINGMSTGKAPQKKEKNHLK